MCLSACALGACVCVTLCACKLLIWTVFTCFVVNHIACGTVYLVPLESNGFLCAWFSRVESCLGRVCCYRYSCWITPDCTVILWIRLYGVFIAFAWIKTLEGVWCCLCGFDDCFPFAASFVIEINSVTCRAFNCFPAELYAVCGLLCSNLNLSGNNGVWISLWAWIIALESNLNLISAYICSAWRIGEGVVSILYKLFAWSVCNSNRRSFSLSVICIFVCRKLSCFNLLYGGWWKNTVTALTIGFCWTVWGERCRCCTCFYYMT